MTSQIATVSLVSGGLCATVTVLVLVRYQLYSRRVRIPFAALMLACALWATGYGFEVVAPTLSRKLFWYRIAWVGGAFVPTAWFAFSLAYAGDGVGLTRRTVAALCVEPTLVVVLVATGRASDLFAGEFALVSSSGSRLLTVAPGPLFDLHLLYAAVLTLAGFAIMGRLLVRGDGAYRRGTVVLLSAGSIPVLSFAGGGLVVSSAVEVTPASFGLAALVVLFGLRSDDLFDVTPVARDLVLSKIRDGIVVLDDRGRVVETNPAARPLFTVPRSEAIGSHIADVCHNSLGMYALLDAGKDRVDVTIDHDDGKRYYEATVTPIGEGEGHDRGWTLVFRDTTERRRTEAKYRTLIENSRDLISVLDPEGNRKYISPATEHVLGSPVSELEGDDVFGRMHPDDRERAREALQDVVESAEPVRVESRFEHADGSWRVLDSVAVNLLDDPTIEGIVVNSRDVTSRRRYEQRLRVLNRILRHDLRNDMNVILGHADLLDDLTDDPERQRHVETIREKASSLVSLGERAREIDRTVHRDDGERSSVEITGVVREAVTELAEENPRLILETHLPDEVWVLATRHVGAAVRNVVENAVEHNDRALPRVGVSVSTTPDERVEVRVVDNGPGIPRSELDALESGTETQLKHVSGLGLWLVKWILTEANATMTFEERDGRGTAVVMRFQPASPPDDAESDPGGSVGTDEPGAADGIGDDSPGTAAEDRLGEEAIEGRSETPNAGD